MSCPDSETRFHVGWILQAHFPLLLLARVALVTALLSGGFGSLAFLRDTDWVNGEHALQYDEGTVEYAVNLGRELILPSACLVLLTECQLVVMLLLGVSWRSCQIGFPLLLGIVGCYLALLLFPLAEFGPKQTMLLAGGALIAYLATASQLSIWRLCVAPRVLPAETPAFWYGLLILLLATFFGAYRGWRDIGPQVREIMEYRRQQWAHQGEPLPPGNPYEEPLVP